VGQQQARALAVGREVEGHQGIHGGLAFPAPV
jgi:hypothetical protein